MLITVVALLVLISLDGAIPAVGALQGTIGGALPSSRRIALLTHVDALVPALLDETTRVAAVTGLKIPVITLFLVGVHPVPAGALGDRFDDAARATTVAITLVAVIATLCVCEETVTALRGDLWLLRSAIARLDTVSRYGAAT